MNASDITKLLEEKHSEDVFVSELRDGPSQGVSSFRLDGWAMVKSWVNPVTYGYEIKVSLNDFRRDNKWHNYLEYCSDFYFVCPWGLIQPEEIAAPAGLLWVSKTGTRLWIKRKAARRINPIPEILWRSVVMRLDQGRPCTSNAEYWKEWLASKEQSLDVGYRVSRRLRELISERINSVQCENDGLKKTNARLQEIKVMMDKLGLSFWSVDQFERDAKERMNEAFSRDMVYALEGVRDSIDKLLKKKPAQTAA